MQQLTTDLMGQACRIFLSLAYPGGDAAVPEKKRHLLSLPPGLPMLDHIGNDDDARACSQVLPGKAGGNHVVLVRLGCCHYPNLKLKAQLIGDPPESALLFSVDTHDAFSATSCLPPPGHADAPAWIAMQAANVKLKEKIEAAWEEAGLLTFNGLLRRDLHNPLPSFS